MFGITLESIVPIRREPAETSEMISQLLFGETVEIIDQQEKWTNIRNLWDNYEGWIDRKMLIPLSDSEYNDLGKSPKTFTTPVCTKIIDKSTQTPQLIPAGSELYNFDTGRKNAFFLGRAFIVDHYDNSLLNASVIEIAKQFLNAPYLWGGRTYFGIDCSGFTQLVYKIKNIPLPRDAKDQALTGTPVNMIHEVEPGDLAFFDNEEGNIIHTGILIDSKTIIHASGKVKIDKFDQQGIFNTGTGRYTHKLRLIKRVLNN